MSQTALGALLHCADAALVPLLQELLADRKRPLDLRLQVARSIGSLPGTAALVEREFKKARRRALADAKSGKLASALTVSLADLGSERGVALLESAAADPAFPQLQTASITALGKLCPQSSLTLLKRLSRSREHQVSGAARRALQVCR